MASRNSASVDAEALAIAGLGFIAADLSNPLCGALACRLRSAHIPYRKIGLNGRLEAPAARARRGEARRGEARRAEAPEESPQMQTAALVRQVHLTPQ